MDLLNLHCLCGFVTAPDHEVVATNEGIFGIKAIFGEGLCDGSGESIAFSAIGGSGEELAHAGFGGAELAEQNIEGENGIFLAARVQKGDFELFGFRIVAGILDGKSSLRRNGTKN